MKRFACIFLIALLVVTSVFANGGNEKTAVKAEAKKTGVVIATMEEPVHFYAFGPSDSNTRDLEVLSTVYDPLVRLEANGTYTPMLAESWEISADGREYTFHLRKNVKFHNGYDFTAEDVKFTYDTAAFKSTAGKSLLINYDHSEIIDNYTIKVVLKDPFAAFLTGCASRVGGICSKKYFDEVGTDGYLSKPIGTGPYCFVSAVSGDTITLKANENYWNGAPSIKDVYIKTMSDATTMMIALENGDVDVVLNPSVSSILHVDESRGIVVSSGSSAGRTTMHITANGKGKAGDDKNFRKALQCGINKQDILDGVNEGYGQIIDIDMAPSYTGHPSGYKTVAYNPEQAKKYLAASNYKGQEFDILVGSGSAAESAAQIIQYQLMELGINCVINAVDNATFNEKWYSGDFSALIRLDNSSLIDADGFNNYYMLPPYVNTENNQYPRGPEVYALDMKGRSAQGADRLQYYLDAVNIVVEEAYDVPLFSSDNYIVHTNKLDGIIVQPLVYNTFIDQWSWK